jgi:hypothetical protein
MSDFRHMNRQRTSGAAESIVAESIPSWNQIGTWLQELSALWLAADAVSGFVGTAVQPEPRRPAGVWVVFFRNRRVQRVPDCPNHSTP